MSLFHQKDKAQSSSAFLSQVESILESPIKGQGVTLEFSWDTPAEAQAHLSHIGDAQKALRQLKQEVSQQIKHVRASYTARRGAVSPSLFARVAGAKRIAHSKAARREKMRQQEEAIVTGYQDVCKVIDQAMRQLDHFEAEIGAWLAGKN